MEHQPAANSHLVDGGQLAEGAGANGVQGDQSPLSDGLRAGQNEPSSSHEEIEARRPSNMPVRDSDYPKRVLTP
jgi:hypothetical protein